MAHTDGLPVAHWTSADIVTTEELFTLKPQVYPELRKSFGQGILTFDIIGKLKGSEKYIASESYKVHEELPPFRTMTIGSSISGGGSAGIAIEFDIAEADTDTMHNHYPRVGQSFWAGSANHLYEFQITEISSAQPPVITAYPKDITLVANTVISAGKVVPLAPAVNAGQGTEGTTPTHTGYQEFTYYLEILKDSLGFENAEFAREKFVEYEGLGLYNHEVARMDMNLDAAMEAKIMFGTKNTNTAAAMKQTSLATNLGVTVPGTQGIWDWIRERGYLLDFTDATDFTIEHFYELAEFGESVGLPNSTWLLDSGGKLLRRIEKSCKSYITNATGSLNEMFTPDAGGGKKDLTVGFRHIVIGGQTIVLKSNYIMNNPYLFGIAGLGLNDAATCYPLGDVREGKTGEMIPNLSLVYRGLGEYKERKRAFAPFLGVAGPKGMIGGPCVLTGDISKIHATVDFGVTFLEAWKGVRIVNTDYTGA